MPKKSKKFRNMPGSRLTHAQQDMIVWAYDHHYVRHPLRIIAYAYRQYVVKSMAEDVPTASMAAFYRIVFYLCHRPVKKLKPVLYIVNEHERTATAYHDYFFVTSFAAATGVMPFLDDGNAASWR